jgi:hypothetical protein
MIAGSQATASRVLGTSGDRLRSGVDLDGIIYCLLIWPMDWQMMRNRLRTSLMFPIGLAFTALSPHHNDIPVYVLKAPVNGSTTKLPTVLHPGEIQPFDFGRETRDLFKYLI